MNFCTICQSFYKDPGTCNCYSALPRRQSTWWVWPTYPVDRCAVCGGSLWFCRGSHTFVFTTNPGNMTVTVPANTAGLTITGSSGMPCNG